MRWQTIIDSAGRTRALYAFGTSSLFAAAMAGCAADVGDRPVVENEQALNLLAELETESGARLRFYEPEPGHIVVLETGPANRAPVIDAELARLPAVQKYERIAGRTAPDRLVEAAARAEQLALTSPAELDVEAPAAVAIPSEPEAASAGDFATSAGVASTAQALTSNEFVNSFCKQHSFGKKLFYVNASGTLSFTWTQLDYLTTAAYAVRGSIRFSARWRPRAQWSGWTSVDVAQGKYASWFEDYRPILGFGWNSYVDYADGDLYHFCSYGEE